ncbi:hypothetical protein CSOJ01_05398 [Colletotrichum sojae]|uniref:Protein kinase domain-containing protein n=1 Tax=Colletotrichum sojae TaxID=2175907 RepID=A0A8H6JF44_9PEZI|nr:hypothetical protein CSOJ01_05398 [Colletotrichum sojae]
MQSAVDDDTTIYDETLDEDFKQFAIGESLPLVPHRPARPYGSPLLWFQTGQGGSGGILEIEKMLAVGPEAGPQVVVCKTISRISSVASTANFPDLGDRVVAKIFDPMFYPWEYDPLQGPWNEATIADRAFLREAAAYEKLGKEGKTGYPHIAPRFYGTFILARTTKNPNVPPHRRTRHVGLVLLEYIRGHLMSDLCDINAYDTLLPKPNPPIVAGSELRLKVLRILLHGYIEQLHAGVEQRLIRPENILISSRGGALHVSLLSYGNSVVDETCEEPLRLYEGWPHPPHPFDTFSAEKLSYLHGWFPYDWLVREFGPVENSGTYTVDY